MSGPRALNCPLCGGTVGPPLGSRRTSCEFCSRPLFYAGEDFKARIALRPKVDEVLLQTRCRSLFKSAWVPKGLIRRATLLKKRRTYLPFYLLTGKRGGVLATGKERLVNDQGPFGIVIDQEGAAGYGSFAVARFQRSKPEVVVEEDSRVILGDFRYLYTAAALENWDILDTDLREVIMSHLGEAIPASLGDLAKSGDVVDADIPLERIQDKGVAPGQIAVGELKVLEMRTVLVYIPVMTLTFRYGRQIFSVTLEEIEGRWVTGRLPFRREWAFLLGLPLVASLGFLTGNLLAGVLHVPMGEWIRNPGFFKIFVVFSIFAGGALAAGLQAAWVLLRTPYVVRVTGGGARVENGGETPPSPLKPLNAFYRFLFGALFEGEKKLWW